MASVEYYRAQAEAFAEFLLKLPKERKRVGSEVRGRCPFAEHEDRNPSFGYDVEKDCWACSCGSGKGSELRERLGFHFQSESSSEVIVTEYALRNLQGEIVAWHIRRDYGPKRKSFSWRVPEKIEEGLHGLKKENLPLYGTEKLSKAGKDVPVILVEGEKAADLLQKLAGNEAVVLGTVTGAPAKPKKEGSPWPLSCPSDNALKPLQGRTVYLWADHDEPGRMHMRQIEENLKRLGIASKRIRWEGAKHPGDDAGDFVLRGGTLEELKGILACSGVIDWRSKLRVTPICAKELVGLIDAPVPYLIKPIIVRGALTQIQGVPKGGKSAFSLYLSLCASMGIWPFPEYLSGPKEGLSVLYLSWEDPALMVAKRLSLYAAGLGFDRTSLPEKLSFFFAPDLAVEKEDYTEAFKAAIMELKPDVIFLDTLSHAHRADENDASEMKIPMYQLDQIAKETQVGIVYLHHTAKGSGERITQERARGSSAIAAAWHILVDWGTREDGSNLNPVEIQSKYESEWLYWGVTYDQIKNENGEIAAVRWEIEARERDSEDTKFLRRRKILSILAGAKTPENSEGWITAEEITSKCDLGIDVRSIRRILSKLCEDGTAEFKLEPKLGRGRTQHLYRIRNSGNLNDIP